MNSISFGAMTLVGWIVMVRVYPSAALKLRWAVVALRTSSWDLLFGCVRVRGAAWLHCGHQLGQLMSTSAMIAQTASGVAGRCQLELRSKRRGAIGMFWHAGVAPVKFVRQLD